MTVLTYIGDNFHILFVLIAFAFFLITQREESTTLEKRHYWLMIMCSLVLLIVVPMERWTAVRPQYRTWRIILSIIAYWARPGALMFMLFSCIEKSKYRILITIPELINVVIMSTALFSDATFGYDANYSFYRNIWGLTPFVVSGIYILMLAVVILSKLTKGHKIESGILFICIIASSLAVHYSVTGQHELVSFAIAISGFFHYILIRSQKHYDELNKQIVEAEAARNAADKANNAKTEFLFNISHDIRTPMNAIIGFSDIVERHANDPDKVLDCTYKIRQSGDYLLSLINEMLEMARIEKGNLTLYNSQNSVSRVINSTRAVFESQFAQKDIEFSITNDITHDEAYFDATKVFELLFNIISNSLKYTNPGGRVDLEVTELSSIPEGGSSEYVYYKVVISDTGIGISEDFLPHIFEEFAREHSSTESKISGTGLGMSIVKKLVDLVEGDIDIKSAVGEGTTTTILLHAKPAEATEVYDAPSILPMSLVDRKLRILLTEDNDLNAEIAITLLEEEGFKVSRAEDGVECINMLSNSTSECDYDLILMDVQMPRLNGYDTTRKIREMENPKIKNIPIIAMTANAFDTDRKMALESGMNDYISKPMDISDLKKIIYKNKKKED